MAGITSAVATTDFLQLLTIQLKNQDPIDPVKQDQFISQLSQFSMLEGIEALNSKFEETLRNDELQLRNDELKLRNDQLNQGIQLVGKTAEYSDGNGNYSSGIVERLYADQGPVGLKINNERISINLVSGIIA